jgi:phage-related protein
VASQAEVDLVISTEGALPQLERDLNVIVNRAEDDTPPIGLEAALDSVRSQTVLRDDLLRMVGLAEARADEIQLEAGLDVSESISDVNREVAEVVAEAEAAAPDIDIEVDVDRDGAGVRNGNRLSGMFSALGRAGAGVATSLAGAGVSAGSMGLAAGGAVPLVAGLVTAVESIAPAAAVAVSGLLAVKLATGTVKLAMIGVEDAISAAFDPDTKPEDLAKAMEKLAPSARKFVTELASMRKELKTIQTEVQDNFFAELDDSLRLLGKDVLPVVEGALFRTATVMNIMAKGAADAAIRLGRSGVLGKALDGAVGGLTNLASVPGQVITALGQLGAAAAPAFQRVTLAASNAATKVSDKLTKAFESGKLEEAINHSIDVIKQLGRIARNVFEGIGNIFKTVNGQGQGLFFIMEKVTKAFADVTATKGFQSALTALTQTASVLVDVGLKVVVQALQLLGPIFTQLGPPIQNLIRVLGGSLSRILEQLGLVLLSVAVAFGKIVPVIEPFIKLATDILVAILPGLIPLFETLGTVLEELAPFAKQLAENIGSELLPFLRTLSEEVLPALLPFFADLAEKLIPLFTEALTQLSPFLVKIGKDLGALLVALLPLIEGWIKLQFAILEGLMPILMPLAKLILLLVEGALTVLHAQLVGLVIPAIEVLTLLLQGRFSEAWEKIKDVIRNARDRITADILQMVEDLKQKFRDLGAALTDKMREIRDNVVDRIRGMRDDAVSEISSLPQRAANALGNAGVALVSAGQDLVQGFIDGILSQLGALQDAAQRVAEAAAHSVTDFLGIHSPSRLMIEVGKDTMEGFKIGLAEDIPALRSQLQGIAAMVPSFALPNGQTLALPQLNVGSPTVQVFIGNERLDGHITTRIAESNRDRDRVAITGVRR